MSDLEEALTAIRGRVEAATKGPWFAGDDGDGFTFVYPSPSFPTIAECPPSNSDRGPNSEFIAHARTDVPRLLAALEAVVRLHAPDQDGECAACRRTRALGGNDGGCVDAPCPTVQAITTALAGGAE